LEKLEEKAGRARKFFLLLGSKFFIHDFAIKIVRQYWSARLYDSERADFTDFHKIFQLT
jgi:hypothetical protein